MVKEVNMGDKFIYGKMVNFDDESLDKLENISTSLKEVEKNIKDNILLDLRRK